jgi:hypothetical protein
LSLCVNGNIFFSEILEFFRKIYILIDKAILFSLIRDPANFPSSEPAIAILRHNIIKKVPDRPRNNDKKISNTPGERKFFEYAQHSRRFLVDIPSVNKTDRGNFKITPAELRKDLSAALRLIGGKNEDLLGISSHNEIDGSVAEIAYAVEKNDRFLEHLSAFLLKNRRLLLSNRQKYSIMNSMNFLRGFARLFLVLFLSAACWLFIYAFLVDEPLSLKEQGLILFSFTIFFFLSGYIRKGFKQG